MSIESGTWVTRTIKAKNDEKDQQDKKQSGFVVNAAISHNATVRWVGSKQAALIAKKTLTPIKGGPPIIHFEGALDEDTSSTRSEVRFLREWAESLDIKVHSKPIWSIDELAHACKRIKLDQVAPALVVVSAHGQSTSETKSGIERSDATLFFAPGDETGHALKDANTIKAFSALKGRLVVFSCCEIGKYGDQMNAFVQATGIEAIAFTRTIGDWEAMLAEVVLFSQILEQGTTPGVAVTNANKALSSLKIRGGGGNGGKLIKYFKP